MADTRKDKRAPVSLKVRFKSATVDEFIEHYCKDVSRGGIFIKSSQPMAIGTLLKFQFQLKDESSLIKGVGRVVWVRSPEDAVADQPAGMGIKFIKMDNESRAMVDRIVDGQGMDASGAFDEGRATGAAEHDREVERRVIALGIEDRELVALLRIDLAHDPGDLPDQTWINEGVDAQVPREREYPRGGRGF